jgi:hypothetical protein
MASLSGSVAKATATSQHLLLLGLLLATTFAMGCTSHEDDGTASRERCLKLRDHLVELRLGSMNTDVDAHRDILRRSLGEEFMTTCAEMSAKEVHCALAATESVEAMTCSSTAAR